MLGVAAYGRWVRGDLDAAIALAHRSIAVGEDLGEPSTGLAERVLGNALVFSGVTQDALLSMEHMTEAAQESGSPAASRTPCTCRRSQHIDRRGRTRRGAVGTGGRGG